MVIDIDTLHRLERQVLLAFKELGGRLTTGLIIEKTGLSEAEVNKAIEWLKDRKLVEVENEKKEQFITEQFALKYVKEGLPEKRILRALHKQNLSLDDLRSKTSLDENEFNNTLGLLKRNDLIQLSEAGIQLTEIGKSATENLNDLEERTLGLLEQKQYLEELHPENQAVVPDLANRRLLRREIHNVKRVTLAKEGIRILPHVTLEEAIGVLTPDLIVTGGWKDKKFRKYNIRTPSPPIYAGKKQPYLGFVDQIKQKLIAMGFKEMTGPVVELSFFNNEALFMPQDHPAREIHDVFHIKQPKHGDLSRYETKLKNVAAAHENGWKTGSTGWNYKFDKKMAEELLLRSQTTAVSARMLCSPELEIPGKYFAINRNFRVDVIDWKHLAEFDQFEGIVVDPNVTFKELLGMLKVAAEEIGGCKKFKFSPGYFPFTEPSVELHAYMEGKGWVEIGGAGIFRPELTLPLGIKEPVLAWGLGILRLFMTKYNIEDMRQIFSTDLRMLREFKW
jgi:phenylalanyl-tRNA synthetase alpha chain